MKKAYWVGIVNVKNKNEYKKYTDIAGPALLSAGANYRNKDARKDFGLTDDALVVGDSGGFQIKTGNLVWKPELKETIDKRWGLAPRQMFQRIGTEFGQFNLFKLFPELKNKVHYSEMWCKLFELWLIDNPDSNIIITDVRFKHEIECIKRLGGSIIKINRNTEIDDLHVSENNIDTIPIEKIDFTIDNNYLLEDLYSQLDTIFYVPFYPQ